MHSFDFGNHTRPVTANTVARKCCRSARPESHLLQSDTAQMEPDPIQPELVKPERNSNQGATQTRAQLKPGRNSNQSASSQHTCHRGPASMPDSFPEASLALPGYFPKA
jgi:hypothetical protein